MKVDIAFQVNKGGQKQTGRNDHPAPARLVTSVDRLVDRPRTIDFPAGDGAEIGDREVAGWKLWSFDAGQNLIGGMPAYGIWLIG
jgi:hypothetical protein